MGTSKVVYGGRVLIDLTDDTVSPSTLMAGVTAHGADGEKIVGTGMAGHIRYDVEQSLTEEEKARARQNIGASDETSAEDGEIIDLLIEIDMLSVVTDFDGSVLADENDNILLW